MELAKAFDGIVGSLPDDWTNLIFEIGIEDLERYVEAAVAFVDCNGQPISEDTKQWRVNVARDFGHAADLDTVREVLIKLDLLGIEGRIRLRDVREGRSEVFNEWGRSESVRQEFYSRRNI